MGTPAQLSEIIDAIEMHFEGSRSFVDRQTGKVLTFMQEELCAAEDDSPVDDMPEWQREVVTEAREALGDETGRFIELPDSFDADERGMMADFIEMQEEKAAASLAGTLGGAGMFRRFKDRLYDLGLADEWFDYRSKRYRKFAIDWCRTSCVPFVE